MGWGAPTLSPLGRQRRPPHCLLQPASSTTSIPLRFPRSILSPLPTPSLHPPSPNASPNASPPPADGITYLFVSNSDNLGATLDLGLLAHFAATDAGFLMEVCALVVGVGVPG